MTTETLETRTDRQALADNTASAETYGQLYAPMLDNCNWEHARGQYTLRMDSNYRAE